LKLLPISPKNILIDYERLRKLLGFDSCDRVITYRKRWVYGAHFGVKKGDIGPERKVSSGTILDCGFWIKK